MDMNKLVIFGDSILKGVIYSSEKKKYELSSDNKYEELQKYGVSVVNNCKMGATIDKGLSILEKRLTDCDDGTTVLFEYGSNDCDYDWNRISAEPESEHLPFTPESEFTEKYQTAINYAKSKGAKVVISTLIPISAQKFMNWISRGKSYDNILKWLGDVDHLARWQLHYNDIVGNIAADNGCEVLDLRHPFALKNHGGVLLCEDGIHPTQAGHNLLVNTLSKFAAAR